MDEPLWTPGEARKSASQMRAFQTFLEKRMGRTFADYRELHHHSIANLERFWTDFRDFADIRAETWGDRVLVGGDKMPGATFFPDAKLNYAENLLLGGGRADNEEAVVFWGENRVASRMTQGELVAAVARFQKALRALGLQSGDRVAAIMPNMPETVVAMLAATGLGAVWCSCSPDFGVRGVLDRFGQIEPKVLIACDGYFYGGKTHDCVEKVNMIARALPTVVKTIIAPYVGRTPDVGSNRKVVAWRDFVAGFDGGKPRFESLPFNHPLFIMFSSGTTGAPKCIVHGAGGTLFKHLLEHRLHCDTKRGSRLFYFTTCGWMMWNWMVSALACGATILLFDGSPFHPDGEILFDYADAEGMTFLGTSAKYIDALRKEKLEPIETHSLDRLETMASTGSPLAPESFDYVYRNVKKDILLASISGGADIIGCFVLGNPTQPVWRGEIQGPALGMAVDVYTDDGAPTTGEKGELVCAKPFPSMPLGFWNDPDGARYRSAYFERFDNIWHHGDHVAWTPRGGMIIHGRSDATLNPGGVRIGTAEIYRQVEKLDEVVESVAIGQDWKGDVRVVLFVRLREGLRLDEELANLIKTQIRLNCTPRHVPARIIAVDDIPRTKSGKITEIAIRDIVHGREAKNVEALANPWALDLYKNLDDLSR